MSTRAIAGELGLREEPGRRQSHGDQDMPGALN